MSDGLLIFLILLTLLDHIYRRREHDRLIAHIDALAEMEGDYLRQIIQLLKGKNHGRNDDRQQDRIPPQPG